MGRVFREVLKLVKKKKRMWGRNNIYEETNELEETYYLSVGRKSSSNLPNPA